MAIQNPRLRVMAMDDDHLLESRTGIATLIKPIAKIGTVISQQTPAELGGDVQMALQGAIIKDPFTDPATNILYQYRLYAVLGNYLGTCCQYRSLALYLTNDGQNFIRPDLGLIEFPCGSGNTHNNIVHLGGGLPFKLDDGYYMQYFSYAPCNEPNQYLHSADGVTNWQAGIPESADFSERLYLDGTHKVFYAPDGEKILATRGWYKKSEVVTPPSGVDFGRFAVWLPVPNFPNASPYPPAGWTDYEANTRNWPKPQAHPATINGQQWANVIMDSPDFSVTDIYTTSAFNLHKEVDGDAEPLILAINTGYRYTDCKHFAFLSFSRNGRNFRQRQETPFYQCGQYGVDPDGAYFFDNIGSVKQGDEYVHIWAAAQYGGKPGCPARQFVSGNQSMQAGYVKLDRYIANRFTNGDALTTSITIPNDGSGSVLHVNVEPIAAGGYLKARVETITGAVIPGFDLTDCIGITTDKVLDGEIIWTGGTLKSLAGQDVKFHFFGDGVDFYSAWLKADNLSVNYSDLNVQVGNSVNHSPVINADTSILSVSLVSGTLPAGVNLNANTGVLSGSATSAGSGSAQIKFTSYGNEQIVVLNWSVGQSNPQCPTPVFQYPALIQAGQGGAINVVPSSVANVHHFEHFGLLHSGLSFNQITGEISGAANQFGTYPLRVRAYNPCGDYAEQIFNVRVAQAAPNVEGSTPKTLFGDGYLTFVVNTNTPGVQANGATAEVIDQFEISPGMWQITARVTNVSFGAEVCAN